MNTSDVINYYVNLLIYQYINQPKARATIAALVAMPIMDQLPNQVMNAYDIGSAVGVQLDVLGKYTGVSRQGYDFTGPVTLTDTEFSILINVAIIQNNQGSSLADIQNLLALFFPGTLRVFDYGEMRIGYWLNSAATGVTLQLAEFFIEQGSLPKPMGVQLSGLIFTPTINGYFGFGRNYNPEGFQVSGMNNNTTAFSRGPWLRNSDIVAIPA